MTGTRSGGLFGFVIVLQYWQITSDCLSSRACKSPYLVSRFWCFICKRYTWLKIFECTLTNKFRLFDGKKLMRLHTFFSLSKAYIYSCVLNLTFKHIFPPFPVFVFCVLPPRAYMLFRQYHHVTLSSLPALEFSLWDYWPGSSLSKPLLKLLLTPCQTRRCIFNAAQGWGLSSNICVSPRRAAAHLHRLNNSASSVRALSRATGVCTDGKSAFKVDHPSGREEGGKRGRRWTLKMMNACGAWT